MISAPDSLNVQEFSSIVKKNKKVEIKLFYVEYKFYDLEVK